MTRKEIEIYPKVAAAWDRNVENEEDKEYFNNPNVLNCAFRWYDSPEKEDFWCYVNEGNFKEAKQLRPDLFIEEEPQELTPQEAEELFKQLGRNVKIKL